MILQTEAAECGLACLAMVAGYHGHHLDLAVLRARHSISLKGATLADLIRIAGSLQLTPRPLRLELEDLGELALPCVLHWDFNHFVVLTQVRSGKVTLHDPATGRRELPMREFSQHFTGVALELAPTQAFEARIEHRTVRLSALIGRLPGLGHALAQILILALVLQIFSIVGPFYMQWVVDQALVTQDRNLLSVLGIGFLLLALVQTGVTALRAWVLMVLGTTLNFQMGRHLFGHLIRLPIAWFDKRHIGDVVSRFASLNTIQHTLTASFFEVFIDGLMALVTLAMMILYSGQLALVGVIAAGLYAALRLALYRPLRLATEEQIIRSARVHSHFLESVRGIQGIKLFVREEQRMMTWQNLVVDTFNAGIRVQRLGILYQGLNGLLFGIENVITIWLGALLVLETANGSGFSVGMLFAFVAYKTQFVSRIAALIEKGLELRMLGLHMERVSDIALATPELRDDPATVGTTPVGGSIELNDVAFRYADSEPLVLKKVNLRVEAGESVAIVGPSGCGKTTLIKLMLSLLQPTEGHIMVGGVPLSHLGIARYRGTVACVMQDDSLFAGSITENICFFDPQPDHLRIETSARLAAIHDEIIAMPMQYNTLVGDMGTVFSGGQKQRILLARALYREPKILFLDEATSHLNIELERRVNGAVRTLNLTRIIVAHRPETIASADRVVAFYDGCLTDDYQASERLNPSS